MDLAAYDCFRVLAAKLRRLLDQQQSVAARLNPVVLLAEEGLARLLLRV